MQKPKFLNAFAGSLGCRQAAGSCRQLPQISGNLPRISDNLPERCLPPAGLVFALVKTAGFLIDGNATGNSASKKWRREPAASAAREAAERDWLERARNTVAKTCTTSTNPWEAAAPPLSSSASSWLRLVVLMP